MPVLRRTGLFVARGAAALQAFVAARRLGEEWSRPGAFAEEARRVVRREGVPALALGAVGIGSAAFAFLRSRELVLAAAAGALVGSGLPARAWERLAAARAEARRADRELVTVRN